ncbi:MAG: peptide-methionine (S)-S-oxide reductase MsrA [Opitutales bacterium]|nr:peptide-methionine (S)-S-oxide reductase MsrA [Opitutales bacterium]
MIKAWNTIFLFSAAIILLGLAFWTVGAPTIIAKLEGSSARDPAALAVSPERENTATLGTGCFWCTEAVLQRIEGVSDVLPGYMGGSTEDAFYRRVISGQTDHVEVVQFTYDPEIISYAEILDLFWQMHDPTQLNRQGNDVGRHYRSVIFVHSDEQKEKAKEALQDEDASGRHARPIVTAIEPAMNFYPAEKEHLNYYNENPNARYCRSVIEPKLRELNLPTQER